MGKVTKKYTASGSPKVNYEITVEATRKSADKVQLKVTSVTSLGTSASYLYTGHYINGYLHIPGIGKKKWTIKKDSSKWSGTKKRTSSKSWNINWPVGKDELAGLKFEAVNGYGKAGDYGPSSKFTCKVETGLSYARKDHKNVNIEASASSQAKVKATLKSIPSATYNRVVAWNIGGKIVSESDIKSTSCSKTFTGLFPNTTYQIVAAIIAKDGGGISEHPVYITTPQETGSLSLVMNINYLDANITGMFDSPNYSREVDYYYKKKTDADYRLIRTLHPSGSTSSLKITKLKADTDVCIKAVIRNGSTVLKTLTAEGKTLPEPVPTPVPVPALPNISNLTQDIGRPKVVITWGTDKNQAASTYKVMGRRGGSSWSNLKTLRAVASPVEVDVPAEWLGSVIDICIQSEVEGGDTVKTSNIAVVTLIGPFDWDTPKASGEPLSISANEWNRLVLFVRARTGVHVSTVEIGDPFSAEVFNEVKNAIAEKHTLAIADKRAGDGISVNELNMLKTAVNSI